MIKIGVFGAGHIGRVHLKAAEASKFWILLVIMTQIQRQ